MAVVYLIIFFLLVVIYYRAKDKFIPEKKAQCSICGKTVTSPKKLKDGFICYDCLEVPYMGRKIDIFMVLSDHRLRNITVGEIRNFIGILGERSGKMQYFHPTKISPSGAIKLDENLGLFTVENGMDDEFAREIRNIESFSLEFDKKDEFNDGSAVIVEGGHIYIRLNELVDFAIAEVAVKDRSFGMRNEVRKTYEGDLRFLEEITGKRRK